MKRRNRSRWIIGFSILTTFLLVAFGIWIAIRPDTILPSSSQSSSSMSQASIEKGGIAANSNVRPPQDPNQKSPSQHSNRDDSASSATRASLAEFSGFTTSDQPVVSATP